MTAPATTSVTSRRKILEWVVTLAVAAIVVLAVEAKVAQPFRVPTASMEPTLQCARPGIGCTGRFNDRVIVAKAVYAFRDPKRFEIAVFHAPGAAKLKCDEGGTFLKRVIGLPGEKVSEKAGFFYIDGKKLEEPYLSFYTRDGATQAWPRLKKDEYFMMGDNRL
ncbi:MAG: signal peptidase I, partial [Gaiellaceae bacterium]